MRKNYLLLILILPYVAVAGGFQMNELGQKAFGMGGAFTALSNDASTVYYNPGAMSFGKKSMFTFGGSFVKLKTNYLSPFNGNIEADNPAVTAFHLYLVYKITDNLSAGLSINNPFGSNIKWANDWEGRYVVQQFKLKAYYFQPSVSYMLNENIGIGAGMVYGTANTDLRKAIPVEGTVSFGTSEYKINGSGIGINAGVYVNLNDEATSFGLTFHSPVKFNLKKGDVTFADIPPSLASAYPSSTTFNSEFKMPSIISIGIAYKFTKNLVTTFQIDLTHWSSFDSLNFELPDYPGLDIRTARAFKSALAARVGAQYTFEEKVDVRIGAAFDQSPVPEDHLSPELPDADKILLSAGAGYNFSDNLSGDFSLGMETYFERKGQFSDESFAGSYKSNAIVIGLGINYKF
jgi:long-chain fatty acid transport protein